ncbi:uncharacterized protein LOC135217666 [Macrobrachium nipponense]|uniref:uncharacterized protein LOC135217666 n=1 Tax=Macrobrachium nipponense TaxID=159736 RepID=UPI0030C8B200
MDGTFDITPPLFSQLYSIHGLYLGRTHPLVYALLPNKRQGTYETLFRELNHLTNGEAAPQSIITDFEMAAICASNVVFPHAENRGCFFHLAQSVHRRIQREGFKQGYENDADFALQCRTIPALAFVPSDDVSDVFEELSQHLPDVLQPVLDYFEDTYIGRLNRRGLRRAPTFPIELWNVHDRVINSEDRTNNVVEAWHRSVQVTMGEIRPSIWKFIKGLTRSQKLRDTEIVGLLAGNPPPPTSPPI